jgi:hypothetical protein
MIPNGKAAIAAYNSRKGELTAKQKVFIAEWLKDKNGTRSAIAAGVPEKHAASMASQWLDPELFPLVAYAAQRALAKVEETAIMTAEEIRRYIHTVMSFCPADYFTPCGRRGWAITMEDYRKLPTHVRRMIEEMELTNVRVETKDGSVVERQMLRCKFVSKTVATGLAAKYGLTEKHQHNANVMTINWDELYKRQDGSTKRENPIERRIREAKEVR